MNITVKLKLCEKIDVGEFQKKYTNVVRYAFNRTMDGKSKYEIFSFKNWVIGLFSIAAIICNSDRGLQ